MICDFKYNDPCIHLIKGDDRDFCKRDGQFICTDTLAENLPVMSHSSRSSWTRCRQKYYYSQIMGVRNRPHLLGSPLKIGIVIDKFMESRYMLFPFKKPYDDLVKKYNLSDVDSAKTYAIIKAYFDLEMKVDSGGIAQYEFLYKGEKAKVKGFMDCFYGDHIDEVKTSGRPDFYQKKHNLTSQLGTYFLAEPNAEYANVKIIRVPALKFNADKESIEQYQDRLYTSIISRPSYYFIGFKKLKRTWGKKFYRNEFPIDQIKQDYEKMSADIIQAARDESFYQSFNCYCPGNCEFLPICTTGGVSEEIYEYRKVETGS